MDGNSVDGSAFSHHITRLAWPERHRLAAGFVLLAGSSSVSLVFPRVMGTVMDACLATGGGAVDGGWTPATAAGVLLGLFGTQSLMVAVRGRILTVAGERIAARLRSDTFASLLLRHDVGFFDRNRSGELQSRLTSDCASLQKLVVNDTVVAARATMLTAGSSLAMLSISPSLLAVSLLTFPPAVLVARRQGEVMRQRQRAVQDLLGEAGAEADRALGNVRTLKLFAAEDTALGRYIEHVQCAQAEAEKVGAASALSEAGVGLALQSSVLLVLAVGGQQVIDGTLTYGDLSAFLLYSTFTGFAAGNVASAFAELRRATGASERVLRLLEPSTIDAERVRTERLVLPPSPSSLPAPADGSSGGSGSGGSSSSSGSSSSGGSGIGGSSSSSGSSSSGGSGIGGGITRSASAVAGGIAPSLSPLLGACPGQPLVFESVDFAYPSAPSRPVLERFNLHVGAGERVALVGPSGCGKSTVTSLLAGLYAPQSGRILIGGHDVDRLERRHLRTQLLSVVPQEPALFSGSLRDNLAVGRPGASEAALRAAAEAAGCGDFAAAHWERDVGERGLQLSGGQKQRVALARVLLRDTPVVILDEFSSALDARLEAQLFDSLRETLRGKTVLLITHKESALQLVDRVVDLSTAQPPPLPGGVG